MARTNGDAEALPCEFSPAGSIFAVATTDGLLKTFDTGTGRLTLTLSSNDAAGGVGHLQEPTTAVAWAPLPAQEDNGVEQSMLVAGSAAGAVQAFNALTGTQLWRTQEAHDGPVESLAFVNGRIYSCGADDKLRVLDANGGEILESLTGEAASAARRIRAATGGENVLLAGSELYLCGADLERQIRRFTGHPMVSSVLATDRRGGWAVSGCPCERHLAVWELKPKRKRAAQPAAAALPMEHAPLHAAVCSPASDAGASFFVAAVEEAGAAYVWECRPDGDGSVKAKLRRKLRLPPRDVSARTDGLLAVWLEATVGGAALLLARGATSKPLFERVSVSQGSAAQDTELPPLEDGVLLPGKRSKVEGKKAEKGANVVSADVVLANGHMDQDSDLSDEQLAGQKRSAEKQPDVAPMQEDGWQAEEEEDLDDDSITLGQRVKALQVRQQQGSEATTAEPVALQAGSSQSKAGSLAVLLSQALQAQDNMLIERCLAAGNDSVVHKTVSNLSAADAALLLEAVVTKLWARASRGQQLAVWIRAVLLRHTASLMGDQRQHKVLSMLYQTIEARLAQQQPLTALLGRLDLLLAQVPDADAAETQPGPVVHVVGRDDQDVAVEDPFAAPPESSDEDDDSEFSEDGEEEDGEDDEE